MNAAVLVGDGSSGISSHPQGTSVVMSAALGVTPVGIRMCGSQICSRGTGGHPHGLAFLGHENFKWPAVRENKRHFIGESVHGIPGLFVDVGLRGIAGASLDIRKGYFGNGAGVLGLG